LRPSFVYVPTTTRIGIQTTVTVPDRGQVLLGGYSRVSEGRNEFGTPGLGKVPYLGRGFGNVGYGREVKTGQVIVGVRIINLYEEEERQTGVRSQDR
jgi:type II secretory pathway component GspD/PulD (secretin)